MEKTEAGTKKSVGEIFKAHSIWGFVLIAVSFVFIVWNLLANAWIVPFFSDSSAAAGIISAQLDAKCDTVDVFGVYADEENKEKCLSLYETAGTDITEEINGYEIAYTDYTAALDLYEKWTSANAVETEIRTAVFKFLSGYNAQLSNGYPSMSTYLKSYESYFNDGEFNADEWKTDEQKFLEAVADKLDMTYEPSDNIVTELVDNSDVPQKSDYYEIAEGEQTEIYNEKKHFDALEEYFDNNADIKQVLFGYAVNEIIYFRTVSEVTKDLQDKISLITDAFNKYATKFEVLYIWVVKLQAGLEDAEKYLNGLFTQTQTDYYQVKQNVIDKVIKDIGKENLEKILETVKEFNAVAQALPEMPEFEYESYDDIRNKTAESLINYFNDAMSEYEDIFSRINDSTLFTEMHSSAAVASDKVMSPSVAFCYYSVIKITSIATTILNSIFGVILLCYGIFMFVERKQNK